MRDFAWRDNLWCVVKDDGTFAGVPCRSWEEARELQSQHENSYIYELLPDNEEQFARAPVILHNKLH